MAFQLKSFAAIAASMIARARATQDKITDFNVGSVARTLMEAPAVEIEELYQRMFSGIMDAIPVAIYRGFDFQLLEPAKAVGSVVITFAAPLATEITLRTGTPFSAAATGTRYLSTADVTAAVGAETITVPIEAERTGAAYNLPIGGITSIHVVLPPGATLASGLISSGTDGETEVERASRFAEFIQSISRGTSAAVRFAAASAVITDEAGVTVEYVSRVGIVEIPGEVQIYIYGPGQVASDDLVAEAQKLIDGYREGGETVPGYRPVGVNVLVSAMTETELDIAVTATMLPGLVLTELVANDIRTRITRLFAALGPGDVLTVAAVRDAALGAPGVAKIEHDMGQNYLLAENVVLVPGTIGVEAA